MKTIKNRFLLTTAVFLAGLSLASAQGVREGASGGMSTSGGAAEHGSSGGAMSHGASGASHGEGMTQGRGDRTERSPAAASRAEHSEGTRDSGPAADKAEHQTTGQARGEHENARQSQSVREKNGKGQTAGQSQSERDHASQSRSDREKSASDKSGEKDKTVGQSRNDRDRTRQSQGVEQNKSAEQNKSTTTGSNTKDDAHGKNAQGQSTTTTGANTRNDAQSQSTKQGQNAQPGTTAGANTQGQANTQAQNNNQAQAQGGTTESMSGRVQVSAQQQTRLQQSVLDSRNVDRVRVSDNSINFRVNTGVVVPRDISVISVSDYPALVDVYPDYRDDSFFVVNDEIVVTDRSRRIVDVIPAGPRTHYARNGGSSHGSSSVAALDLSPDEIRIVQRVLIQRGMLSGEADGILGPDTRAALTTFQRQEGFQPTGSIDSRTVAALGVSSQISATQGQSTTVGQGQNGQSIPQNTTGQSTSSEPAQQDQTTGQAPQNRQSTSGQAQQNQPTNSGQPGTQQPSGQTTGQAPAQGNNPYTSQPSTNQSTQTGPTNQDNAPASSTSPAHK